ncbi:MAG: helix-turn-helix domain-containing protein [Pseudorhodobacter sp.]
MSAGPEFPRPPAHVEPYVRILGLERAIAFLLTFGGGELYLPISAAPPPRLVEVIGMDHAARLCQAATRLPKRVPTAKPWIAGVWRSEGLSATEIARRLHVSDVAVRGWLRKGGQGARTRSADPRQFPLL